MPVLAFDEISQGATSECISSSPTSNGTEFCIVARRTVSRRQLYA